MSVGTLLVIVAAILVVVAMLVGYTGSPAAPNTRPRNAYFVLCFAVLLICIALCIGVEPFVRT
jgi:hypothetical protein